MPSPTGRKQKPYSVGTVIILGNTVGGAMEKIKKQRIKKPTWFSLDNYQPSKDIDYWMNHLWWRLELVQGLKLNKNITTPKKLELFDSIINRSFKKDTSTTIPISSVVPLSKWDVYLLERDEQLQKLKKIIKKKKTTNADEVYLDLFFNSSCVHDELGLHSIIDDEDRTPCFLVSVDLSSDDETILNDFKRKLKMFRDEYPVARKLKISNKDFSDWYLNAVLPYFDIMKWAEIMGIELYQGQICEWLWPNARIINPEAKLRRTAKKHFNKFFSWDMYRRMEASSLKKAKYKQR